MLKLAEIYPTFQGEVNRFGIGAPAIFLRLAGCHLRCYKKTLDTLCDTPHFLEKKTGADKTPAEIVALCVAKREETGIPLICLTGGDPLWNDQKDLEQLFLGLVSEGFYVSVETSGIDYGCAPYWAISENISWVFDWKLASCGIPKASERNIFMDKDSDELRRLRPWDFIKFVVYDNADYAEMQAAVNEYYDKTEGQFAVGPYWGGPINALDLFNRLSADKMLDRVLLNFQSHKALLAADYSLKTEGIQI